ncbi:MAG: hypothetical protein WA734_09340, partial [Candidatus Acidiferrales bacterium]
MSIHLQMAVSSSEKPAWSAWIGQTLQASAAISISPKNQPNGSCANFVAPACPEFSKGILPAFLTYRLRGNR